MQSWETKPGNTHFKSPFGNKKEELWLEVMTVEQLFTDQEWKAMYHEGLDLESIESRQRKRYYRNSIITKVWLFETKRS